MAHPNLLTAQQHRFVLAIIEGKTQAEAYKDARFPSPNNQQLKAISNKHASTEGGKLMRDANVAMALARAQARSLALASTNLASLVEDLQEARAVALNSDPPQTNGAVAATMGIAKLLGLAVDRAQVEVTMHKPGFSSEAIELGEDEWKRQFTGKPVGKSTKPLK